MMDKKAVINKGTSGIQLISSLLLAQCFHYVLHVWAYLSFNHTHHSSGPYDII